MGNRLSDRIPSNMIAKYFHNGSVYYGLIADVSERGMCIRTGLCLPKNTKTEFMVPLKGRVLNLPARVRRVVRTKDSYDLMGVELMDPPETYLEMLTGVTALETGV